ncbi:MAG: polysaccharide deacetylase family protein [Thermoguttaceae bacterium]|jgi:peptidoglycan/xylan/chitin deacetylase (PgdA/CDA1 family)
MRQTRREFLATAGAVSAACVLPEVCHAGEKPSAKKSHIVTLSFDDGFKRSSIKTAEIYEKHKLSACINVVASAHMKDFRPPDYADVPRADFGLWNDLKARGHEVMPHGYKHANKRSLPFAEAKHLILRCFDVFDKELKGFDRKQAVFNFPYNASTPELEKWLPTQVRAFRTGGGAINPLPYKGQTKLTCTSFGPGNCEAAIDREVERLLAKDSGWLIFNTHGLDDEGWGPIRAVYLERLLERLLIIESVEILPAGMALAKYTR